MKCEFPLECDFSWAAPHLDEQPRAKVVAAFLALRILLIKKGENDENLYSY